MRTEGIAPPGKRLAPARKARSIFQAANPSVKPKLAVGAGSGFTNHVLLTGEGISNSEVGVELQVKIHHGQVGEPPVRRAGVHHFSAFFARSGMSDAAIARLRSLAKASGQSICIRRLCCGLLKRMDGERILGSC